MGASKDAENTVYQVAKTGLMRFLNRAREVVLAPFRQFGGTPNADAIYELQPMWNADVERIMAALTPALQEGWGAAHLPGNYDPNDPYIQANLALTHNLLVRVPDEVHSLVVREILEGSNNGESTAEIAARIEDVLTYTGSENWNGRAKTIAQTECNRHYNSSLLAHGLLVERQDGGTYIKHWETQTDGKERADHLDADHQPQPLGQPFIVGGEALMFPGDPLGRADNVINCRCGQTIEKVG